MRLSVVHVRGSIPDTPLCTGEKNSPLTSLVTWACSISQRLPWKPVLWLLNPAFSSIRTNCFRSGKGGRVNGMFSFLPSLSLSSIYPWGSVIKSLLAFTTEAHLAISFDFWTPGESIIFLLVVLSTSTNNATLSLHFYSGENYSK